MRVISLVPSATETLVALGIPPDRVHSLLRSSRCPDRRGDEEPGHRGDRRPAPGPRRGERRGESHRRRRRARDCGHHVAFDVAAIGRRRGPAVVALATALDVPVPAPFDDWAAWRGAGAGASASRVTAFVATWRRPYMTMNADTYGSSLLACIGVDNVFGASEARYPEVTLADAAARAPQLVLLPDEPYAFAARHIPEVQSRDPDRARPRHRRPGPVLVGHPHTGRRGAAGARQSLTSRGALGAQPGAETCGGVVQRGRGRATRRRARTRARRAG